MQKKILLIVFCFLFLANRSNGKTIQKMNYIPNLVHVISTDTSIQPLNIIKGNIIEGWLEGNNFAYHISWLDEDIDVICLPREGAAKDSMNPERRYTFIELVYFKNNKLSHKVDFLDCNWRSYEASTIQFYKLENDFVYSRLETIATDKPYICHDLNMTFADVKKVIEYYKYVKPTKKASPWHKYEIDSVRRRFTIFDFISQFSNAKRQ